MVCITRGQMGSDNAPVLETILLHHCHQTLEYPMRHMPNSKQAYPFGLISSALTILAPTALEFYSYI